VIWRRIAVARADLLPESPVALDGAAANSLGTDRRQRARRGSSRFDNRHAAIVLKISLTLWEQDFNPAGTCVTRHRRRNPCKI
jgi:hypothetical protein